MYTQRSSRATRPGKLRVLFCGLVAVALSGAIVPAPRAAAAEATFAPDADTYVDSSKPTRNFGSRNEFRVDGSPTLTSYLRFAVSGATDFSSARLRLYVRSNASAGVEVRSVTNTGWDESSMTWDDAPPIGPVVATSVPASAGTWVEVDVSGLVTQNGPVSFAVTTSHGTAVAIRSRESSDVPSLIVGGGPPANQDPVASFTYGCTDLACSFDATASNDPDGTITSYDWTFGSDGSGSGMTTNHTFSAGGDYDVTLTVTDDMGATDAATQTVSVSSIPPPSGGTFVVSRNGNTYQATSAGQTFSGTLKSVVESAVADLNGRGGGTVSFTSGDFDLGSDWFHFTVELVNITFEGQGIDVTVIRNYTTVDSDTEPFNFRGTDGVVIRDLTVSAGGTFRNTSDAIDFDRGNNSLVERVKISASRAKGIIFDGKNVDSDGTPWHSQNNIVRDCEITGTNNDGIQFLASSNNRVENCTIHDVGQDGIDVRKSQSDAQQPNKKSNGNVLIGNTITNAGENGIRITSSDDNQLINNTITDSSSQAANMDGIRIESANSITCDDNTVDGNSATDTRSPKLQAYGLNITSALCNRSVVGSNSFAGNRTGDIRDQGTDTQYQPTDTEPPSAPTGLSAVAPAAFQVDLSWTAATDNIGVTGYEIFRDGSPINSVGPVTSYQDFTVAASTTYAYQVRALDAAGNQSALSGSAQVTTPPPAGSACTDSSPNSGGYTVTVCITSPADGASLAGDSQVAATVSVNGSNPGIQKMLFWLGSEYLLTDYQAPFTFTLETTRWADGQRTLLAEAYMRDGFVSDPGAISASFANGISQPPPNTGQFTPTQGTTPAPGQPFVFATAGDGADGSINAARVTDLIASWNPNMFSYAGDVYERGTATEFTNWYGIDTNYGRFRSITNPVIGNHENLTPNSHGYFDYWDNAPNYYSVDVAGWHLLFLDSTGAFGQTSPSSQQYQWIAADLAASSSSCTLAVYHHPAYTIAPSHNSGDPNRVLPMWSLLADNGVDVVINGHDHDYQRWLPMDGSGSLSPGGTTEFVVGTGGHGIQGFVRSDNRVAVGFDTSPAAFGALRMELNAAGAAYQFVDIDGNVLDSGSVQCGGSPDSEPPSVPTNLVASATSSAAVDLSWTGSTDNIGVTAYDIYRDGQWLAATSAGTTFTDTTTIGQTTYSYVVRARDAAGNASALSAPASVTTPTLLFSDDFEIGNLGKWTSVSGLLVQSQEVFGGSYAARGTSSGSATWAWRALSAQQTELYYRMRFKVLSQPGATTYLGKYRSSTGVAQLGFYLTSTNRLGIRNDVIGSSTTSTTEVTIGAWHELQVRFRVNGSAGESEVWLDGVRVDDLALTMDLGTTPIGRIQLGDNAGGIYDVAFDDVALDTGFIGSPPAPDTEAPSPPTGLAATAPNPNRVDLSWTAATDNVGVTAYDIYRNSSLITSVGPQTTYVDLGVAADTTYQYQVRARDAAGNVSGPSNTATVTTPAPTGGGTFTITPSADSYVEASAPTKNNGTKTQVRCDGSPEVNSYLKFAAGVGGTVASATLRIWVNSNHSSGFDVHVANSSGWTETGITYANAPGFGGIVGSSGGFSGGAWVEVDVTSAVDASGDLTLVLTTSSSTAMSLASREGGATAPQLVIETQ